MFPGGVIGGVVSPGSVVVRAWLIQLAVVTRTVVDFSESLDLGMPRNRQDCEQSEKQEDGEAYTPA